MQLTHLIADFFLPALEQDVAITQLSLDSRTVTRGTLFFALPGTQQDGRTFIDAALQKGASAILQEALVPAVVWQGKVPIISLPNLSTKVSEVAARFYAYPAQKLRIIGVTGTSGKTSCTQFIAAALHQLGFTCGVLGTLGNGLYGNLQTTHLTTPDAISVQKFFAEFLQQQATTVAMEVSSHSLAQNRVKHVEFTVGVFTNLTRDHLDYHGNMEAYGAAKKRLFEQAQTAVINRDDAFGKTLLQSGVPTFAYSLNGPQQVPRGVQLVYAEHIELHPTGITAQLCTPWGSAPLSTSLVGAFNLSNLLAVLTTLCLLDIPLTSAIHCLADLQPISGRMQTFGGGDHPLVIVDYAHKPDALEKVLQALRQQCRGKLFCVFGCGGERDRGKRPLMAKIAEHYADHIIVTDDNPRREEPQQIVAEILQGFSNPAAVKIQHDRSQAIHDAIQCATVDDCVLIAGKGAETYQQIGEQRIPFSDIAKVKEILARD